MTLEDEARRAFKAEYDKVCATLLDEEILQLSCLRNVPEMFEKKFLKQRITREHPQLSPGEIDARVTQEYEQKRADEDKELNKFVITEEVRALRKYRKKFLAKKPLTREDEEYIIALMRRVRAEQGRPEYEYYSPKKYQDAEGNLISFEKDIMLKILSFIDQMQKAFPPEK